MNRWIRQYRVGIQSIFLILLVILFIMPFSSRVTVTKGDTYDSVDDVALYIMKFDELPDNFVTKSEAVDVFASYYIAVEYGYNIGGDVFRYEGEIINLTRNINLRECDIYFNREEVINTSNRGASRLVYTANGDEVFVTNDHYTTFSKVTMWEIQQDSIRWWVVLVLYTAFISWFSYEAFRSRDWTLHDMKHDGVIITRTIVISCGVPTVWFERKLKRLWLFMKAKWNLVFAKNTNK